MGPIRNALLTVCMTTSFASVAIADDASVVSRLTSHSSLSSSSAKKLVGKVNVRMAKSADATASVSDPMRAAVSLALFQAPTPPNSMAAAKVRLRLYAGLNEWALEAIFAPQPGVIAGCVREVGASQSECEALVAAAAKSSVAQIRSIAGGPAGPAVAAPAYAAAPAPAPAAAGGSRFGRFNSGYQAAPAAQQQYAAPQGYAPRYAPPRQQAYAPPAQQGYNAPRYAAPQQQAAARPAAPAYQRPVAPPPPAAPVVSPQELQSRKEAYKAQREAYLARQKQQFEERKNKLGAANSGEPADAPAAAVAAAPSKSAPATAAKGSAKAAAVEPESDAADAPDEPVAAKSTTKALDGDFLDGLLDDPLGGKGKK